MAEILIKNTLYVIFQNLNQSGSRSCLGIFLGLIVGNIYITYYSGCSRKGSRQINAQTQYRFLKVARTSHLHAIRSNTNNKGNDGRLKDMCTCIKSCICKIHKLAKL